MSSSYDAWLEAPYQQAAAEADAFIDYCEDNDLDPDTWEAQDAWDDHLDDYDGPDPDDERDRDIEREWAGVEL